MKKADDRQVVNGILLVNKPKGLTSNAVLQQVKRLFNAKKAGHTGSLDPMATGMLPVCFGEATKFCQYLLDADKCYEATAMLGIKTNTGDAMGEIIAQVERFTVSEDEVRTVLQQFTGCIKQVPSMFSALKHQGKPLYKFARAGIEIERKAREIWIHQLQLNQLDGRHLSLTIQCSKGTYIRNLVEDIGDQLGSLAHLTRLHRSYTAGLADESMYTIDELSAKSAVEKLQCLLPMERAVNYLPKLVLSGEVVQQLRQGKVVADMMSNNITGCVRLYNNENTMQFIGLGELQTSGILKVRRLLSEGSSNQANGA